MSHALPPSGPWTGYYLYGYGGAKHPMTLTLRFTPDGVIEGDGLDDISPFAIHGSFDPATSAANWTKAYLGLHAGGLFRHLLQSLHLRRLGHRQPYRRLLDLAAAGESNQVETQAQLDLPIPALI